MKKHKYTHRDSDGLLWRFVGMRPVSELADKVMDQLGDPVAEGEVIRMPVFDRRKFETKAEQERVMSLSYEAAPKIGSDWTSNDRHVWAAGFTQGYLARKQEKK